MLADPHPYQLQLRRRNLPHPEMRSVPKPERRVCHQQMQQVLLLRQQVLQVEPAYLQEPRVGLEE